MKLFTACEHAWTVRYCGRVHGTTLRVWIEECVRCGKQVARDGDVGGEAERWLARRVPVGDRS